MSETVVELRKISPSPVNSSTGLKPNTTIDDMLPHLAYLPCPFIHDSFIDIFQGVKTSRQRSLGCFAPGRLSDIDDARVFGLKNAGFGHYWSHGTMASESELDF